MPTYKKYLIAVALLIGAFLAGRYSSPARSETKKSVQTQVSADENINRNQDVVTVVTETRKPDGTFIKETRKEKATSTQTQKQVEKQSQKSFSQVVENRPDYRLGLQYNPPIPNFQDRLYTVTLEHRLFSEFYAGVSVSSDKTIGLVFSLGF